MQSFSIWLQTKVNSVKGDQTFIFKWVEQNYLKGFQYMVHMSHLDFFDTNLLLFKTFKQLRWFGLHRNWWYFCFWRLSITIGLFLSSIVSRTGLNTWIRSCHSALIVIQSEVLNGAILLKPEKKSTTHTSSRIRIFLALLPIPSPLLSIPRTHFTKISLKWKLPNNIDETIFKNHCEVGLSFTKNHRSQLREAIRSQWKLANWAICKLQPIVYQQI